MKKIIMDTNFWLLPFEKRVDIFSQLERLVDEKYKIIVPQAVIDELREMEERNRRKVAAKSALLLMKKAMEGEIKPLLLAGIEIDPMRGNADGVIMSIAGRGGMVVATNDRKLRERLRGRKIKAIVLRNDNVLRFA